MIHCHLALLPPGTRRHALTTRLAYYRNRLDDTHGLITGAITEGKPLDGLMRTYRQLAGIADENVRLYEQLREDDWSEDDWDDFDDEVIA